MSTYTISFSSELMKNYQQAERMSPTAAFEALQTERGLSLVFSVGSDGVLRVTREVIGSGTGWTTTDLSSAAVARVFAGKTGVSVTTFATAQRADGTIGIAMVVSEPQGDHLYLSLGNSAADTSWLDKPSWTQVPFDDTGAPLSRVKIARVLVGEAKDGEYVVVDVLNDPDSKMGLVRRYYVDAGKVGGQAWQRHELAIDLEAGRYSSALGRQGRQSIDGLYTAGQVGKSTQLVYQPLYNLWKPGSMPTPARLQLPGGGTPDAIVTVRRADQSTDLYVAAKGSLYRFASDNQKDQATATLVMTNPLFTAARKLFADLSGGTVTLWGLSGSNEVFYTSCPADQVTSESAWSHPVPICSGVHNASPYVNRVDAANTIFAASSSALYKLFKSPDTTLWSQQQIALPAASTDAKATAFSSYTSRIQITDQDRQPVPGASIQLSASTRSAFYINHLYYVLDSEPIEVKTDNLGSVTIIEWVEGLQGTQLTVSDGKGRSLTINPMDKPFKKVATLTTAKSLKDATITSTDGSSRKLLSPSATDSDIQAVAAANKQIADAYASVSSPGAAAKALATKGRAPIAAAMAGSGKSILVEVGDFFRMLKSGVKRVVRVIKDGVTSLYHMLVTIGEEVFECILDSVEKVVGAVEWVFNAIVAGVKDLIEFLEYLFEWGDMTRTKKVLKHVVKLFLIDQVNALDTAKDKIDQGLMAAKKAIDEMAGYSGWGGLGAASSATLVASSDPTSGLDAPAMMLSYHFQSNAGAMQTTGSEEQSLGESALETLVAALKGEERVLREVLKKLSDLAKDFRSMSLADFLKKAVAILADFVLGSLQVVADALIDFLREVALAAIDLLDTPIHIPVISDILAAFGVPSLSLLDAFCWIGAVPVTITYKLAHRSAPFPDDRYTSFLETVPDFQTLAAAFSTPPLHAAAPAPAPSAGLDVVSKVPESVKTAVFITGHCFAGFFSLMSCFVAPFDAMVEPGEPSPFGTPSAIIGGVGAGANFAANFLSPRDPLVNDIVSGLSTVISGTTLVSKLAFTGAAKLSSKKGKEALAAIRLAKVTVDAVLVLPALFCSAWHFYELSLSSTKRGKQRDAAILEETSSLTGYVSRVCYAGAVWDPEPVSKVVLVGVMVGASLCSAGLQTSEAIVV